MGSTSAEVLATRTPDAELSETEIVARYRPFIHSIAARFTSATVSEEDLVQEGTAAMLRSFRLWRPDGGCCVLTWITHPVRVAMSSLCARERNRGLRRAPKRKDETRRATIFSIDQIVGPSTSLEASESCSLHELIGSSIEPPDYFARTRLVLGMLSLSERERAVIRARFVDGLTLRETGDRIGLSRERARNIEAEALEQLRRHMQSRGTNVD